MNGYTPSETIIHLVDDNPANLNILFEYLTGKGFKVSISKSGKQALERIELLAPHIILLDVMMPPGIDGFEVCRRLKASEETREIPVIFMTALTDTGEKLKGFKAGAVDYVTKPIQHEEVYARIHTHLTIRAPLWLFSHVLDLWDRYIVDMGIIDGIARLPRVLGKGFQPLANGVLQSYAVSMVGGVGLVAVLVFVMPDLIEWLRSLNGGAG